MGLFEKIKNTFRGGSSGGFTSTIPNFSQFFSNLNGNYVSQDTALKISTVYACINCIAGAIKAMPLKIYKRDQKGSFFTAHPYALFLNERASDDWAAADAWAFLIASKFLYGDGFARLIRSDYRSSIVQGWLPIHPYLVTPFRDSNGIKRYKVAKETQDGASGGFEIVNAADMIQITSLGYDGVNSPSVISAAGEVLKTALAGQSWQSKFFTSGANFDYVLSSDKPLQAAQVNALRESILNSYSKDGGPLILSAGLKPMSLTINPRDAELLQSRIFTMEEICRVFGVPPIMVGHSEKSSSWGSGISVIGQQFVRYTLLPHLSQIAQEFNYKLWPDRQKYFLRHDTSELERGDYKHRNEAYRVALGRAGEPGWLTINEVRAQEDLYPVSWGDDPLYTATEEASKDEQ